MTFTLAQLEGTTGVGVRVLIIDSGVDDRHEALSSVRVSHFAFGDADADRPTVLPAESSDDFGHGTAVASIIASHAPAAELTSLGVFGRKRRATSAALLDALDWGIAERFDVINVSLGTTYLALLARFKQRVDDAFVGGSIVVSASNNFDVRIVEFPAHFPTVISVESASLEGLAIERVPGRLVEFRARGVDVRAAWRDGAWTTVTGSSFAAPHVSALVARMKEREPGANAAQIKARLYDLARA